MTSLPFPQQSPAPVDQRREASDAPGQGGPAGKDGTQARLRGRRRPGRPPAGSEDKRERILKEAVSLFGARGYAATSLGDIAAAADISKAGLLHHFSSKEDLFTQVLQRRDDADVLRFMSDTPNCWAVLDAFTRLVEHNSHNRAMVALYTAVSPAALDAAHPAHDWMVGHLERSVTVLQEALEQGKQDGLLRADAPSETIARTLTALSDGLQLQWLAQTTPGTVATGGAVTDMAAIMRQYVADLRERWEVRPEEPGA